MAPDTFLNCRLVAPDDGEDLLDAVFQAAVERIAQVVLVEELLADDRRDQCQADVGRGPLVLLQADGALAPVALGRAVDLRSIVLVMSAASLSSGLCQ